MEIQGIEFDWGNPGTRSKLSQFVLLKDEKKVSELLNKGSNPDVCDNRGFTSLHFACKDDEQYDILKLLIKHGAYVHHETHEGITPLCVAARNGCLRSVKLLLSLGASLKTRPSSVMTGSPLHFACKGTNIEIIKIMLEKGAEVNFKDRLDEVTPLMVCASEAEPDACQLLLDNGANATDIDSEGRSPLHYAVARDRVDVLEVLAKGTKLQSNVCVNRAWSEDGWTLLMEASQFGSAKAVRWLLDHGAETCAKNKSGLLALHLAAHNSKECFNILIQNTPTNVINEVCCVTSLDQAHSYRSIPFLLLQKSLFSCFEELFGESLEEGVYNAANIRIPSRDETGQYITELQSPISSLIEHHSCSFETKKDIINLYINKNIPIDPKYKFGYSRSLLYSLLKLHSRHHDLCQCVELFSLLIENGARLEVVEKRVSFHNYNTIKHNILPFFMSHGYTYGIACILKFYSDFNIASFAKEYCKNLFKKEDGDDNPVALTEEEIVSLQYMFKFCSHGTLKKIKRSQLDAFNGELPDYCNEFRNIITTSLSVVHSLKQLVRISIRDCPQFTSQDVKNSQIPNALIKYILFDDVLEDFAEPPSFPIYRS